MGKRSWRAPRIEEALIVEAGTLPAQSQSMNVTKQRRPSRATRPTPALAGSSSGQVSFQFSEPRLKPEHSTHREQTWRVHARRKPHPNSDYRVFVTPLRLARNRVTRARLPHSSAVHHRRVPLRVVSRNSQPQFCPSHSRTRERRDGLPAASNSAAVTATRTVTAFNPAASSPTPFASSL